MNNFFTNHNTVKSSRIIYTPSSFARSSLLYLQEVGNLQALKPHVSSRADLDSYLLFIVLSGEGVLTYNGITYQLMPNYCVFIDCTLPYSHSTSVKLWKLQWCHFNGPEMKRIYEKYKARGGLPVFYTSLDYFSLLSAIHSIASSNSYLKDMKINSVLSELLVLLMEDAWNPDNVTEKKKMVQRIRDYLDGHYYEKISLDVLSEQFFIDKYYLCRQFKDQYGITINDYLASVRITEAKKLLRFSDKTMEEIASIIGVNGAAYFSRLFKKVEGVSPNEFRKMW